MKLKRTFLSLILLCCAISLSSCEIFSEIIVDNGLSPSNIIYMNAKTKTTPEFEAYKEGLNSTEYFYFNIGKVEGVPILTSESVEHTGNNINHKFTIGIKSQSEINSNISDAIEQAITTSNITNSALLKTTSSAGVSTWNIVASTSTKSGTKYSFVEKTIDDSMIQTGYTSVGNKDLAIENYYSKYKDGDYYTSKQFEYYIDGEQGYYRYGAFADCDAYAIIYIDNINHEVAVQYKLFPIYNTMSYGVEYATNSDFNQYLTSKLSLDLYSTLDYYNYKTNNAATKHTVTFNSNGGSSVASLTVSSGTRVTKPTNPTRTGYTFDGWYTNSSCTNEFDFTTYVTNSITLYAKWTAVATTRYTITFVTNGGTSVSSQSVLSGSMVTKPTNPTRTGYTFNGWYTNSSCTILYDFTKAVTSSITLYASWTQNIDNNNITFSLGTRTYYTNGLGFQLTILNKSGATLTGFRNLNIKIYVADVLRANANWTTLSCGAILNNGSKTMEITFPFSGVDVDFWDANRGLISYRVVTSYDVVR